MDLIEQPDTVKEAPGGRDAVSLEGETRLCGELPCAGLLDAFCSSLSSELNASTETVRAYRADVSDYLRWCARYEIPPLGQLIVTCDATLPILIKHATLAARRTVT